MSSEIRITRSTRVQNPAQGAVAAGQLPYVYNAPAIRMTLDQAVAGGIGDEFVVPTTAGGTALPVGAITAQGILEIANLDPTNYVQFGPASAGSMVVFGRINPGESWQFRLDPSTTMYLLAHTATVRCQYKLLEN